MQIIIHIDEDQMVRELYSDLTSQCDEGRYTCIAEDHEEFQFTFQDEDGNEYEIDLERATEGFMRFVMAVHEGEFMELSDLDTDSIQEPEFWSCGDIDLLLQYTIEGRIVEP
jgi:hypothetical protein